MVSRDEHLEDAIVRGTRVTLANLAKQAMLEGTALEHQAYRCQAEAEQALKDQRDMKAEGQRRALVENPRLLPQHQRATDVRTNSFKAMQDAKGDHLYYSSQATMFAALAGMKFAKAAGLKAMAGS